VIRPSSGSRHDSEDESTNRDKQCLLIDDEPMISIALGPCFLKCRMRDLASALAGKEVILTARVRIGNVLLESGTSSDYCSDSHVLVPLFHLGRVE
jgi:hypothetical protein